jgi:hypothetical protein
MHHRRVWRQGRRAPRGWRVVVRRWIVVRGIIVRGVLRRLVEQRLGQRLR